MRTVRVSADGWGPVTALLPETFLERLIGLRGSDGTRAMMLRTGAVHGRGMDRTLSVVAIDAGLNVVGVRVLHPGCLIWERRARYLLELPAGHPLPAPGTTIELDEL